MAKISRFPLQRPSTRTRRGGVDSTPSAAVGEFLSVLSGVAEVGGALLSKVAKREALQLRAALEARQVMVNESEAGVAASNFGRTAFATSEQFKKDFAESPQAAIGAFVEAMRTALDNAVDQASNADTKLRITRSANSIIASGTRGIAEWALVKQTQNVKIGLKKRSNDAVHDAEQLNSTQELAQFIEGKVDELSVGFQNVHGGEVDVEIKKFRGDMTMGFMFSLLSKDPILAGRIIQENTDPILKNLTGGQRETLRGKSRASINSFGERASMRRILTSTVRSAELVQAIVDNDPNLGGMLLTEGRKLKREIKKIKVDRFFNDEQRSVQIALVERDLAVVDAIDFNLRRGFQPDREENLEVITDLLTENENLFGPESGKNDKDLRLVLDFYDNLLKASKNGSINVRRFTSHVESIALSLPEAILAERGGTGWWHDFREFFGSKSKSPRDAGNQVLKKKFEGDFDGTSIKVRARVRTEYMRAFSKEIREKNSITPDRAKMLALEALSLETGENIVGVLERTP